MNLHNQNIDQLDAEEFGDLMLFPVPETTLRVVSHNVNNLPENAKDTKSRKLIEFIRSSQASVFCAQEIGLYMNKLEDKNQWFERILGVFQTSTSLFAHNIHEPYVQKISQAGNEWWFIQSGGSRLHFPVTIFKALETYSWYVFRWFMTETMRHAGTATGMLAQYVITIVPTSISASDESCSPDDEVVLTHGQ